MTVRTRGTQVPCEPAKLPRPDGSFIAYHKTPASKSMSGRPGIIFLGGFASDMTGSKATALERFARDSGHGFVRFDYLGHGASSGRFEDGTIGRWSEDAIVVLDELTEGPQILVGSSMGGWLMLLVALARPARVAGLVGIAAAPDFTETLMWQTFPPEIRETIERDGVYYQPSSYEGEAPYPITKRLIIDGRRHLLMDRPIPITCPVRLIHGTADADVPHTLSLALMERLEAGDVEVTLVKGGDHRLSGPADLDRLTRTVAALAAQLSGER
ncbi:MAG: alpha/beta hydrolase [Alphaproteobacteria bacterium]|nr:MAG: alpha/beta hydrolase [Alphaproteobacteria bacterium]